MRRIGWLIALLALDPGCTLLVDARGFVGDAGGDAAMDAPDAPAVDVGVDSPDAVVCSPSREDLPDLAGFDENCDGIDGDPDHAIFVAVPADGGDDANPGTRAQPVATIGAGIVRAAGVPGTQVYVASGDYRESIVLVGGVGIYGGFDADDWSRPTGAVTRVLGGTTAVRGDLDADVELQRVSVVAEDAVDGASSFGVLVTGTGELSLVGCDIEAGDGGAGSPGDDGAMGAMGADGNPSVGPSVDDRSGLRRARVSPMTSACGAEGGHGGAGFSFVSGSMCAAAEMGGGAGGAAAGTGCAVGATATGTTGGRGGDGDDGRPGPMAGAIGTFDATGYTPPAPVDGVSAMPGTGGGGGGGGSACDTRCGGLFDGIGASGGSGGNGGCPGGVGRGGEAGGASVAVLASGVTLRLVSTVLRVGTGGRGGDGGDGAEGGRGGMGGLGTGFLPFSPGQLAGGGGAGGPGGDGGTSGGGSGGTGGPAIGLVLVSSSIALEDTLDIRPGVAGGGGVGGIGGGGTAPGGPVGRAQARLVL